MSFKDKVKTFLDNLYDNALLLYVGYRSRWAVKNRLLKGMGGVERDYHREVTLFWDNYFPIKTTAWHNYYARRNGLRSPWYIPEDVFYGKIEPFFNNIKFAGAYSDKALYSIWFPGASLPVTLLKNVAGVFYDGAFSLLSRSQVKEVLRGEGKVIIKASIDSGAGRNITVIDNIADQLEGAGLDALLDRSGENYVVQRFIEQHPVMAALNPSSVNTVRIISLLFGGDVHVLSSHVRIGVDGAFMDHGGIVCGVDEDDGTLSQIAYKYKVGSVVQEHPQGYAFAGVRIPNFEEMKSEVIKQHKKFGHFKLVSWDFAVDDNGAAVLIEFNLRWQGLNHHQLTQGPLFGELTPRVLKHVFGGRP